ncbi:MAG: hypothetical protein ACRYGA_14720 [Janthinobacterium lividum]
MRTRNACASTDRSRPTLDPSSRPAFADRTWTRSTVAPRPADALGAGHRPALLRGRPLGRCLQAPLIDRLEADEAKATARLRSQLASHSLDHIRTGAALGRGSAKEAFEIPGTYQVLVATRSDGPDWLCEEIVNIGRLKAVGMPVASISQVGNFHGREAMVMKRYEAVFKPQLPQTPAGREFLESPWVNRRTLDDLVRIRDTIRREELIVYDLQYGLDRSGRLAVLDPMSLGGVGSGQENAGQLRTLDELIGALGPRVGSRFRNPLKGPLYPHA